MKFVTFRTILTPPSSTFRSPTKSAFPRLGAMLSPSSVTSCCVAFLLFSIYAVGEENSYSGTSIAIGNSGFEEGFSRWESPSNAVLYDPPPEITSEQARSGSYSLRLEASTPRKKGSSTPMVYQTIRGLKPNSIYYLSAWAKGGKGGKGSIRTAIKLEYYNEENRNTHGVNGYLALLENGDWTKIQAVARTRSDTSYVKIYARNREAGAVVYFDDFVLMQPSIIIVEPTRLLHIPGEATPVSIRIWTDKPLAQDQNIKILATHNDKTESLSGRIVEIEPQSYEITVELPAIMEGYYTLTAAMDENESPVTARTFASIKDRKPENLTDTGTILHNGEPFFPIGIYHPQNWTYYNMGGTNDDVEGVMDDYKRLAAMGFNAVQGSATKNIDMFGRYLDEAHKNGLVVDVPFYARGEIKKNLPNSLEKIRRFKDHPAVLNWKISDEPDLRPAVMDEVPEAYRAMKEADPRTPVEVTLATDDALDSWSNFMDIIQINRYPLPDGDLTAVSDYTRLAVQNKQPWQNVSYVVQSGWTKPGTVPTPEELRCMIYLALIEGAKGIWYYTMYDPEFDLSREAIWPHLKDINAEILKISHPVMLGELNREVLSSNDKIYSRALEHEGRLYILVTNPERDSQRTRLSLPEKWNTARVEIMDGQSLEMKEPGIVELEFSLIDSKTLILTIPENTNPNE